MMQHLADSALRKVPGWRGATLRELPGGLTNRSWLVEKDGKRAVLKIDDEVRDPPHGSRLEEADVQTRAAASGLANVVLYADEVTLMTEYVEGTVWESASLETGDNIERLAAALRRLHALPLTGRAFDAPAAARGYAAQIEGRYPELAARCRRLIESMRQPRNPRCCHNDLVAANIIATPGIMFLDWEYACDNDPMFDLATVVEHHDLPDESALRLLVAYFGSDGARWLHELAGYRRQYRALYGLWLAARPDADVDELQRVVAGIPI